MRILCIAAASVGVFSLTSCSLDDGDYDYFIEDPVLGGEYNALVTVKKSESGTVYFQLDDSTTVEPINWNHSFSSQTRALCYLVLGNTEESEEFSFKAEVKRFNEVLTKDAITSSDSNASDIISRQDQVEILDDWLTVCEDGYLTLHFAANFGESSTTHIVNLVKTSDDPVSFRFCQDSNGDYGTTWASGIVAFRISELLPNNDDNYGTFNLSWLSASGEKSATFKYKTVTH